MEASVKRPGVQETSDQGPELCCDEGPVGGRYEVSDTHLRIHLVAVLVPFSFPEKISIVICSMDEVRYSVFPPSCRFSSSSLHMHLFQGVIPGPIASVILSLYPDPFRRPFVHVTISRYTLCVPATTCYHLVLFVS